jgi:hypothetical protein
MKIPIPGSSSSDLGQIEFETHATSRKKETSAAAQWKEIYKVQEKKKAEATAKKYAEYRTGSRGIIKPPLDKSEF